MKLEPGLEIPFRTFPPITTEQLQAYADASGDFNRIHLDEEVAKSAGLPGVIAHGMLIAALIAERARILVQEEAQVQNEYELCQFQTRFKAMTLLGDSPSVGGTLKEISELGFSLDLQARNQRGEITTVGNIKYRKV